MFIASYVTVPIGDVMIRDAKRYVPDMLRPERLGTQNFVPIGFETDGFDSCCFCIIFLLLLFLIKSCE
jgi:hypothetical protein